MFNRTEKIMNYEEAANIMHTKLCSEFVKVCKLNPYMIVNDIPEAVEISIAIKVLEKIYPNLNNPL